MKTELLWIYEGLTSYLGDVLTARAGLRAAADGRDALAYGTAQLDARPGRGWRPLADTAVSTPALSTAVREWRSVRRGLDYYPEALLVWLEADVVIRQKTGGRASLDDFCRAFHGKSARGRPEVVPYTLDDVVAALGDVCPHAWRDFFEARVYRATAHPPVGGIEQAGWKLAYHDEPPPYFKRAEEAAKEVDYTFSLGIALKDDGTVIDVVDGSPAARAAVAPASKVVAVNSRALSRDVLRAAVAATKTKPDVELLVENDGYFRTHRLAWKGGNRFPALVRDESRPDLLSAIFKPRGPSADVVGAK
jgi:predicted metalloprotease with PDZ domain